MHSESIKMQEMILLSSLHCHYQEMHMIQKVDGVSLIRIWTRQNFSRCTNNCRPVYNLNTIMPDLPGQIGTPELILQLPVRTTCTEKTSNSTEVCSNLLFEKDFCSKTLEYSKRWDGAGWMSRLAL